MGRKIYDRVVGKMGGDTKMSKAFSEMVRRFQFKKAMLGRAGYKIEYVGDIDGTYTSRYEVIFPDGHKENLTQGEVEAINC